MTPKIMKGTDMSRETEERARTIYSKALSGEKMDSDEEVLIYHIAQHIHDEFYHPECTSDNGWMDTERWNREHGWTVDAQLPSRTDEYLQPWESTKTEGIHLSLEQLQVAWDLSRWFWVGTTTIDHLPSEGWDEEELEVPRRTCERCGHSWILRRAQEPMICPKCKSPYWNKPRQRTDKRSMSDSPLR